MRTDKTELFFHGVTHTVDVMLTRQTLKEKSDRVVL